MRSRRCSKRQGGGTASSCRSTVAWHGFKVGPESPGNVISRALQGWAAIVPGLRPARLLVSVERRSGLTNAQPRVLWYARARQTDTGSQRIYACAVSLLAELRHASSWDELRTRDRSAGE